MIPFDIQKLELSGAAAPAPDDPGPPDDPGGGDKDDGGSAWEEDDPGYAACQMRERGVA